jgi:hypothetical protein
MIKTERKFGIWKCFDNNETLIDQSKVLEVLGITKNGSLVIGWKKNKSLKKFWVKKEFFESSYAPPFKFTCNKTYGYIIRELPSDKDVQYAVAFIAVEKQSKN